MTAYRNDQARMDSEAANRAIDREQRNEQVARYIEVFGAVLMVAIFVWGLAGVCQSGLFSFLSSNQ